MAGLTKWKPINIVSEMCRRTCQLAHRTQSFCFNTEAIFLCIGGYVYKKVIFAIIASLFALIWSVTPRNCASELDNPALVWLLFCLTKVLATDSVRVKLSLIRIINERYYFPVTINMPLNLSNLEYFSSNCRQYRQYETVAILPYIPLCQGTESYTAGSMRNSRSCMCVKLLMERVFHCGNYLSTNYRDPELHPRRMIYCSGQGSN